jgi:hypothetical protein
MTGTVHHRDYHSTRAENALDLRQTLHASAQLGEGEQVSSRHWAATNWFARSCPLRVRAPSAQ